MNQKFKKVCCLALLILFVLGFIVCGVVILLITFANAVDISAGFHAVSLQHYLPWLFGLVICLACCLLGATMFGK